MSEETDKAIAKLEKAIDDIDKATATLNRLLTEPGERECIRRIRTHIPDLEHGWQWLYDHNQ